MGRLGKGIYMNTEIAERVKRLPQEKVDSMIAGLGESRMPYIEQAISVCYDRTTSAELGIDSHHIKQVDIRKALIYVCVCDGKLIME